MRPAKLLIPLALFVAASAARADDQPARVCYSAPDAREQIIGGKLADPFALMRQQAGEHRAEAIGVKLCRVSSSFVYEIDLLRRDGRLIHTKLDAATGKPLAADGRR